MSEVFFEAGDVVTCAFFGDKEFVLESNDSDMYPVCIFFTNKDGRSGITCFTKGGLYFEYHTHPVLKLVRKKKKEAEVGVFYKIIAISTSPFFMTMRDEVFETHIDALDWIKKNGIDSWEYQIEEFYKVKR